MIGLATVAFGLIAAGAWNKFISDFIALFLKPGSGVVAELIYAVIITVVAIAVVQSSGKAGGEGIAVDREAAVRQKARRLAPTRRGPAFCVRGCRASLSEANGHAHRPSRAPVAFVPRDKAPHLPPARRDGHFGRPDLALCLAAVHAFSRAAHAGPDRRMAPRDPQRARGDSSRKSGSFGASKTKAWTERTGSTSRPSAKRLPSNIGLTRSCPIPTGACSGGASRISSSVRPTRSSINSRAFSSGSLRAGPGRLHRRRGAVLRRRASGSRHRARLRSRAGVAARRAMVRGGNASARPGPGAWAPRTARHASRGLRLRGRERRGLWDCLLRVGSRGLGGSQLRVGSGIPGDVRDPSLGRRGAEAAVAAADGAGRVDRLFWPDRAGLRQQSRRHADLRAQGRIRLAHRRHENVDHQRIHRRSRHRLGANR